MTGQTGTGRFLFRVAAYIVIHTFAGTILPLHADQILNPTNPREFQIPEEIGSVVETWRPEPAEGQVPDHRLIYLISDPHTNPSGQKNLTQILEALFSQQPLHYVFLEAATDEASLSFLRSTTDSGTLRAVSLDYVERGLLHGSEMFSLLSDKDVRLWGVENQKLYEETVRHYRALVLAYDQAQAGLAKASKNLHMLKIRAELIKLPVEEMADLNAIAEAVSKLTEAIDQPKNQGLAQIDGLKLQQYYFERVAKPINRKIRDWDLGFVSDFVSERAFQDMEQAINNYHELIRQRNHEFVGRMLSTMDTEGESIATLVAGSDHMEHLESLLQSRAIGYVRIQPRIEIPTDVMRYRQLLFAQISDEAAISLGASDQPEGLAAMIRPLMTQAPYDLQRAKTPVLADIGRALGEEGDQKVAKILNVLRQTESSQSESPDSTSADSTPAGIDQLLVSLKSLHKDSDWSQYLAFKKHSGELDEVKDPEKDKDEAAKFNPNEPAPLPTREWVTNSIRGYEKNLLDMEMQTREKRRQILARIADASFALKLLMNPEEVASKLATMAVDPSVRNEILRRMVDKPKPAETWMAPFKPEPNADLPVIDFLAANVTSESGMPLSYFAPKEYWQDPQTAMSEVVDGIIERQVVEYSVNIYDAATWQIALALSGNPSYWTQVDSFTNRLLSGKSGAMYQIRAFEEPYLYGDDRIELDEKTSFFFRIISDKYLQSDPRDGREKLPEFPNLEILHHEDWKPVAGEQAWAGIIGPLQVAYLKNNGEIPVQSEEMKLAMSIMPAIEAMVSPVGAIYHAPWGTHGKDARDISNENNFSMIAAMRMMQKALEDNGDKMRARRIEWIVRGQENYFRNFAYDPEAGVFYQGGFYVDGEFVPTKIFAVDCQTWGIIALTPKFIDEAFGDGATYRMWQQTKERAGFFDAKGEVQGVGFTDSNRILSVEWTAGAILATEMAADYYRESHPDWAREMWKDSVLMRYGIEEFKTNVDGKGTAYLYASERFFIPFGWWANPIPSTVSSAWVIMLNRGFNPFVLGGGPKFDSAAFEADVKRHSSKGLRKFIPRKFRKGSSAKSGAYLPAADFSIPDGRTMPDEHIASQAINDKLVTWKDEPYHPAAQTKESRRPSLQGIV